jgi:hypothetical protein
MRHASLILILALSLLASGCGSKEPPVPVTKPLVPVDDAYKESLARLNDGREPERDEAFAKSCAAILEDLAAKKDPSVYLELKWLEAPKDPPEVKAALEAWGRAPEFQGRKPEPFTFDAVYSPTQASLREQMLFEKLRTPLYWVADDRLLKLKKFDPDVPRDKQVVLLVTGKPRRGKEYQKLEIGNIYSNAPLPYLAQKFDIEWTAAFVDRTGKKLAEITTVTEPAEIRIQFDQALSPTDPEQRKRFLDHQVARQQLETAFERFGATFRDKLGIKPRPLK